MSGPARVFDAIQLGGLAGLVALGAMRMLPAYARGGRVVVADRERTAAQVLADLATGACLVLWWYELVAFAWPLGTHLVPASLGVVLVDAPAAKVAGVAAWVAGLVTYARALAALGPSWRIGLDRTAPGPLVTHGIFARTRNPVYLALELAVVGTFLVSGRLVFLVLTAALVPLIHGQIRREERFLAAAWGEEYRRYCARAGRYLPRW